MANRGVFYAHTRPCSIFLVRVVRTIVPASAIIPLGNTIAFFFCLLRIWSLRQAVGRFITAAGIDESMYLDECRRRRGFFFSIFFGWIVAKRFNAFVKTWNAYTVFTIASQRAVWLCENFQSILIIFDSFWLYVLRVYVCTFCVDNIVIATDFAIIFF